MATNDTAALIVALEAKLDKFQKDLDGAADVADRGARKIEDRFAKINPQLAASLDSWISGLLTTAGVVEAIAKVQRLSAEVAQLGESAQRLGIGVEQFQQLRYAIVAAGGSLDSVDQFLDRFSKNVVDAARGQGVLADWVRVNNVQLKDARGQLLPLNELLFKFSDLLKNTATPQERLNLAMTMGGRQAGPELATALGQGSAALKKYMEDAENAGAVIGHDFVEHAKEMQIQSNLAWLKMKVPMQEFAVLIKQEVIGGFYALIDIAQQAAIAVGAFGTLAQRNVSSFGDAFNQVAREKGLAALRAGQGIPLQQNMSGFPGYGDTGPTKVTVTPDVGEIEFRKLLEQQQRRADLLQAEARTVGMTAGEQARLRAEIELESQAREKNIPLTDERRAAISREADAVGRAAQAADDYKRKWAGINDALRFSGNLLVDALDQATQSGAKFGDIMTGVLRSVTREMLQAAITGQGALAQMMGFASNVSGGTGGILGLIAGLFKPTLSPFGGGGIGDVGPTLAMVGRAGGGPIEAGQTYLVGEQGPELFTSDRAGQVIPNDVASRMGAGDINVTLKMDLTGVNGEESMARIARTAASQAVQQAVSIVNANAPSRQLRYQQLGT